MSKMSREDKVRTVSNASTRTRSRTPTRSVSRASSKISYGEVDVSSTTGSHDYKKIARKLARDKASLKDKLTRLLDEVDNRSREHRKQIEKTQDYYQSQISELSDERDHLLQELNNSKTTLIEERENFRRQLEDKMTKHRELMEKRFSTKDTQVVKRLEATIEKLQERLNAQLSTQMEEKETIERSHLEREGEFRQTISELQTQIQSLRDNNLKERKELQTLMKNYNDERDRLARDMAREKEAEIAAAVGEKNAFIANLQHIRDNAEKRAKQAEQNRDEVVAQVKNEMEATCSELRKRLSEANDALVKRSSQLYAEVEGKLLEKDRQHKEILDSIHRDYERKIQSLEYENSKKIENLTHHVQNKHENDQKLITKLQTELENIRGQLSAENTQKEQEVRIKYEQAIEKLRNELSGKLENKEKDFEAVTGRDKKIIGELQDINENLKGQILGLQAMLRKVQENSQHMNGQFVTNLNQQKELAEKEISNRDNTISQLEKDLKRLAEESLDRMNSLERRLKFTQEENTELSTKLTETKNTLETTKKQLAEYMNDTVKGKSKVMEDLKNITEERDRLRKNLDTTSAELATRKQEGITAGGEIVSLRGQLSILYGERKSVQEELDKVKKSLENYSTLNSELNSRKQDLSMAANEILSLRTQLSSAHAEKRSAQEELENVKKTLQNIRETTPDVERLKQALVNLNEKHENIVRDLTSSHTRQVDDLNRKIQDKDAFISQVEGRIQKLKEDFLVKLNEARSKSTPGEQAKIGQLEKEKEELKNMLVAAERKMQEIHYNFASMESTMKMRNDMLLVKEKELEKKEEALMNAPPKLLDPTIKKTRDQALADLRNAKLELSKVKDDALEMTQKLQAAEGVARELEKEKKILLQAQHELKTTFVNNLNQQQSKHEQEIALKDTRIRELEEVLTQKIR